MGEIARSLLQTCEQMLSGAAFVRPVELRLSLKHSFGLYEQAR